MGRSQNQVQPNFGEVSEVKTLAGVSIEELKNLQWFTTCLSLNVGENPYAQADAYSASWLFWNEIGSKLFREYVPQTSYSGKPEHIASIATQLVEEVDTFTNSGFVNHDSVGQVDIFSETIDTIHSIRAENKNRQELLKKGYEFLEYIKAGLEAVEEEIRLTEKVASELQKLTDTIAYKNEISYEELMEIHQDAGKKAGWRNSWVGNQDWTAQSVLEKRRKDITCVVLDAKASDMEFMKRVEKSVQVRESRKLEVKTRIEERQRRMDDWKALQEREQQEKAEKRKLRRMLKKQAE